jgi:DNA-binding MarR family transcriptional regulator
MQIMKRATKAKTSVTNPAHWVLIEEGLVHFLESIGWVQAHVGRLAKLDMIHLALLRRARFLDRGVSFAQIKAETGMPAYAISRAAAKLVKDGFGTVRGTPSDKRWKGFVINDTGREHIERVDHEIATTLRLSLRAEGRRLYLFNLHLHELTRMLPNAHTRFPLDPPDVGADNKMAAEENETEQLMLELASKARASIASSMRSAIESVRW